MIIIESSKLAVWPLVADRPHFKKPTCFVTISPNPRTLYPSMLKDHRGKLVKKSVRYGALKQSEQYDICMNMIRTSYIPYFENCELVGTTELNKDGNVHMHFLIQGDNVKDDYDLSILRRQIMTEPESVRNISKKGIDYMNNIVYLDKSLADICAYMDKDYPKNVRHFPNYKYTSEAPKVKHASSL